MVRDPLRDATAEIQKTMIIAFQLAIIFVAKLSPRCLSKTLLRKQLFF